MEIETLNILPEKMVIPLKQHTGEICEPLVDVGDTVITGQKIGEAKSYSDVPVHSSVCGEVTAIQDSHHPDGSKIKSIIIKPNDSEESVNYSPLENPTQSQLISRIKDAGVVDYTGEPIHSILQPENNEIHTVIINATCSEWMYGHFKSVSNSPEQLLEMLKLLIQASGASKGAIVLSNDDEESIDAFERTTVDGNPVHVGPLVGKRTIDYYLEDMNSDRVVVSQDRIYGKNTQNLFTYFVTGCKLSPDKHPNDAGIAICSVKSAKALYDAIYEGKPSFETVISVSGVGNANPQKELVKVGTLFKDVIEHLGGYRENSVKLIANGTMTGIAQYTDEVPVIKTTTGITIQTEDELPVYNTYPCIHCTKCVDICPMELVPSRLAILADQGRFDECREMHVMNCIECGRCAAICPSKRHLLQLNQYAKEAIRRSYEDYQPKEESSNVTLGCSCGGGR
ncbi:electron transport complex, RnfABCDGE type, C subunit [Methanohalobium evestigatum Z-7303]|uniref:Electron transport complex, RnfABCDGE type, C subunit n=1 Tax=Methanohalobium evestigatum (strain ATCC BAA-1072 / DSM 3721 / NBRC 107634 / OCM 161 / Z-7303) TaxID=644295 RepID=D7EAC7_METEZ|nr:RnfABCDGE type electron transport complex subunit C [Methanohalobium evestigatum]ADI74798.1 electron transport complex, RnfABCDGE type, C subunit [Methanohalobium evestigatum Z-7303]